MSKIKLFCGFMLTCCDNSVSVIFTRTHQSSWINCHWPVFFPILIQGPTSGFSVLLPPGLLTPFCMGGPAFSLFSVLWYLCPQNTEIPNYFFHEVKYFYYGLIDSSSVEGKSSFCQLLSSLICFGKCFWLGE